MNPGPISDTTKTAIEALKTSPAILALLLFNLAFIGLLAWVISSERSQWSKLAELLVQTCGNK
jgi:ABC-type sulfate transport system permease component